MIVEPSCLKEMTDQQIARDWPNLSGNHHYTSEHTNLYNCVAWVTGITNRWVDFFYDDEGGINPDQSANRYAAYFETFGFKKCESSDYEEGIEKIAIYEDRRKEFTHVALQLTNTNWTSKLGEFEDIEHYSLEALSGRLYGSPVIYMQRQRIN